MSHISWLSVPASRPDRFEKAFASGAGTVIVDLEDAVAPGDKDEARSAVGQAPEGVVVRVNAARTSWCNLDLAACAATGGPTAVLLPKVETPGDIAFAERLCAGAEARSGRNEPLGIYALIESAAGITNAVAIARESDRLRGLVVGYADLALSLGRRRGVDRWLYAQDAVLTAARASGLSAIDGPFLGVEIDDDFRAAVERAAVLGFDGKWVIHPRQVGVVEEAFARSPGDLAKARSVLDALVGTGVGTLDGQMIDEAAGAWARRVLAVEP